MTLPYSPSRAVYQGNGTATAFPFAFKVWSTDQLSVSLTSPDGHTTPAQGWTASLGENGGTLTYLHNGTPLPDGWRLAIVRDMPFAQGIDLVSASRFDPQVIEDGLDQATAELQQLNEKITRAVIMPATSEQSPEEVVASVYASRDAAAASANEASTQATAAQASAMAAASSAETAEQTVQTAAADAVMAATAQANAAAASALAAAESATNAEEASSGLAPRMDAVERKTDQQDSRLATIEDGVTALSTTLIGSVHPVMATDTYVPNGCVPANGGEYTRAQFPTFFDDFLVGGKLLTCTYAAFAAQVALTGNCTKFALDTDAQKFRVPLYKDGDSITQAASAAELGKSVKAGLPNATGGFLGLRASNSGFSGAFAYGANIGDSASGGGGLCSATMDLSRANPIYGNSTTVTDEQVRLRHFVVVASAQNNASVFDWSAYMAALAGKANSDLSNATNNAIKYCFHACDIKSQNTNGGTSASAAWQTRDLNTINENTLGVVLAGNRFTLTPGTYRIKASVPAFRTTQFCGALYDYTHGQYLIRGTSESSGPDATTSARSFIDGVFTVSATTTFELRMYTLGAVGTWGLGYAVNAASTPEKFSEVQIWKV